MNRLDFTLPRIAIGTLAKALEVAKPHRFLSNTKASPMRVDTVAVNDLPREWELRGMC